jgi:Tol biopolymer transport system component/DNA-binding winged helix-turn-helix (wHTH) protein
MESSSNRGRVARFGLFEADLGNQRLERRGARVHLQDKPLQLLGALLNHAGELVTRDQLRRQLWSAETFVEFDEGVNAAVGKLRYALGDSAESPIFIETIRGKGYRWIAPVEWVDAGNAVATPTESQHSIGTGTRQNHLSQISASSSRRMALIASIAIAFLIPTAVLMRGGSGSSPTREIDQKQVSVNSDEDPVQSSSMSPDGKYLAYVDSHGIHLKLLETGEIRDVADPASLRDQDMYWGLGSWSPDSTRVLAIANLAGPRYQAWTVAALGGTPMKVRDDAAPWVFSPDGSKIVFSRRLGRLGLREIWQLEPDRNRKEKLLQVDENSHILGVQLSPDGKLLGYLKESQYDKNHEVSLEIIDLSTGAVRKLLSNEEIREFLWLPKGRILYTGCRTDIQGFSCNYGEMSLHPDTGRLLSGPKLLTQWAGFSMANTSATADGRRLAFQRESERLDVYIADFDNRAIKLNRTRRLTHEEGMNFPSGWTRDGASILFGSNRTGQWGIFRQRLDNTSASPIIVGLETISRDTPLTPDGKWLMHMSYPKGSPWFLNFLYPSETGFSPPGRLFRTPIDGGLPETLLDDVLGVRCTSGAKGFCSVATRAPDVKTLRFMFLDPAKGIGKLLAEFQMEDPSANYDWDLSPDGSTIAVYRLMGENIHLIPIGPGNKREIHAAGWTGMRSLKWSPDGRGFFAFCASAAALERDVTLLYLDLKGRPTRLWTKKGLGQQSQITPSPDGQHVAFTISRLNSNVWLMDNF